MNKRDNENETINLLLAAIPVLIENENQGNILTVQRIAAFLKKEVNPVFWPEELREYEQTL